MINGEKKPFVEEFLSANYVKNRYVYSALLPKVGSSTICDFFLKITMEGGFDTTLNERAFITHSKFYKEMKEFQEFKKVAKESSFSLQKKIAPLLKVCCNFMSSLGVQTEPEQEKKSG